MFFDSLQFSLNVTLPTILMMLLGVWLRRKKMMDDQFCNMASKVVFNFALPAMLFLNVARNPTDYGSQIGLITVGFMGTLLTFFLAEMWAARHIRQREYRGIFVQATFRSNIGILGLAMTINAYGNAAIAPTSVYTAGLVILFNVLGVITLSRSLSDSRLNLRALSCAIIKNPLILSIVFGVSVSYWGWYDVIPQALMKTTDYLAHITLPLALICTGASLDFKQLGRFHRDSTTQQQDDEASQVVFAATLVRLFIAPVLMFIAGKWIFQLNPMQLGILFLTNATPVASATYAMVRNYGGNATIAANIIGLTTVISIFVSSIGLFLLRQLGWI